MMTIDFGNDVKQCVLGTGSSLVKSVVERPMLLIQDRVEAGEIRTEKWKGKRCRSKHLKMLKWSDAKDVISQRYVQRCDGLSRATRVSSRASRVRKDARLSEAARCEITQPWRGDEDNIIDKESVELVLDRTCAVARMVRTSVESSWIHRRTLW